MVSAAAATKAKTLTGAAQSTNRTASTASSVTEFRNLHDDVKTAPLISTLEPKATQGRFFDENYQTDTLDKSN